MSKSHLCKVGEQPSGGAVGLNPEGKVPPASKYSMSAPSHDPFERVYLAFGASDPPRVHVNLILNRLRQEETFARTWGHYLRASTLREAQCIIKDEIRKCSKQVVFQTPVYDTVTGAIMRK